MNAVTSPVLFPPLLWATDGSASAQSAQGLLVAIARQLLADGSVASPAGAPLITVLHVQPLPARRLQRERTQLTRSVAAETALLEVEADDRAAHLALQRHAQVAAPVAASEEVAPWMAAFQSTVPSEVALELQVRQGRPATEILNCARTVRAGLIAVGQRGTGGMRDRWLGSVSAVVARYAPCSVLVMRGRTEPEPCLRHVLLVIDDHAATQAAIALTRQLAPAGIQQITLLTAQSPLNANYLFGPFATPTPSWHLNQSLQAVQKEQSEHGLQHAKQALNLPEVSVQMISQTSEAGPLVCQIAQQRQADLIILGSDTRRRSLLTSLPHFRRDRAGAQAEALPNTRLSPSDDYTIHHAPCPVLLCRSTFGTTVQ